MCISALKLFSCQLWVEINGSPDLHVVVYGWTLYVIRGFERLRLETISFTGEAS